MYACKPSQLSRFVRATENGARLARRAEHGEGVTDCTARMTLAQYRFARRCGLLTISRVAVTLQPQM